MTIEGATGVVLRTRLYTDTSLIVHWLTPEFGRIATIAKGARRPKSAFRGKLDLFYEAEFSFHRSRRSDLHTLREVVVREAREGIRRDYDRLCQAAYGALLVEQVSETETPLPGLYALLCELLANLDAHEARPALVLAFEVKVLTELGLAPEPSGMGLGAEARLGLGRLGGLPFEEGGGDLAAGVVKELGQVLGRFIEYHLDRVPRGRAEALGAVH